MVTFVSHLNAQHSGCASNVDINKATRRYCRWLPAIVLSLSALISPYSQKIILLSAVLFGGLLLTLAGLASSAALAQLPDGVQIKLEVVSPPAVTPVQVAVIAENVLTPGLFGGQFELHYQPTQLRLLETSLAPGPALEPAIVATAQVEAGAGNLVYAVSRRGNVENVTGTVRLATLAFEPLITTTQTTLSLQQITLGAKDGTPIPVDNLPSLELFFPPPEPAGADLLGQVAVEGAPRSDGIRILAVDQNGALYEQDTAGDGQFLFANLPPGTYTISAEKPGYLAATCAPVVHLKRTQLASVTLRAGDVNGDGRIDIDDAVAFGRAIHTSSSNPTLDFNADNLVDILDFILLAANYERTAADNPWRCRPNNPL